MAWTAVLLPSVSLGCLMMSIFKGSYNQKCNTCTVMKHTPQSARKTKEATCFVFCTGIQIPDYKTQLCMSCACAFMVMGACTLKILATVIDRER